MQRGKLGIPAEALGSTVLDAEKQAMLASLVDKVAFVEAINDAWALIAFAALGRTPCTAVGKAHAKA